MFNFKNNDKKEAKDILYADSIKQRESQQERNELLNELKGTLTPAQILYSDVNKLKQIKEEQNNNTYKGLTNKEDLTPAKVLYGKDRNKTSENIKTNNAKTSQNNSQILKGERFSGRFEGDKGIHGSNLHNAFGSADFLNNGIDKDGNLHLYMFDTYDFNKGENAKVEAGRRQMEKGNLKGMFSLHEIVLSKDELNNLWKQEEQ